VNRSRHAILVPLFAVLALLCCLTETASAAFNHAATEPHYGNFLLRESKALDFSAYEIADPIKENGEWIYDGALGVPAYVRQNPWTKFDPLGLWETDSYWGDVGKFYTGMGKAAGGLVKGVATSVVDLPQNMATIAVGAYDNATDGNVRAQAGATLSETGSAIKSAAADYGNNIAAGKMEALGNATFQLLSIATPVAASKATTAANIAKAERVTALAGELASGSTAAKGGAVNVMIAKNGQIFSGVSKNVQGSGVVSSSVEALYGTARKTCAEARTLSAMEAAGVSSKGAVSASAAVNLPGRATGELMQACRQACAPVLKNSGVHDAVGAGGTVNPQMLSVPAATPALPLLNKVGSLAEEDDK
jgi:hypothetical protein